MREIEYREFPWGSIAVVDTVDICAYLSDKYRSFPAGGHIYHGGVDVTPRDAAAVRHLQTLSGEFSVAVSPGGPTFIPLLISTAISIVAGYLLRPSFSVADEAATWDPGSPTNSPGRLSNSARIGKRVPDIYGLVRHTPDLLAPLITRYEANQKVEYAYLSVGRGLMSDVRFNIFDGDVPIDTIAGYSASVWRPDSNIYDTPQHSVGNAIDPSVLRTVCWRPLDAGKYEAIPPYNNHDMDAIGSSFSALRPVSPDSDGCWDTGHIRSMHGTDENSGLLYDVEYDFSVQYPPGSKIRITNTYRSGDPGPLPDIEGDYIVLSCSGEYATLDIPDDKREAWESLSALTAEHTFMDLLQIPIALVYTVPSAVNTVDVTLEAPSGLYYGSTSASVERRFNIRTVWTRVDGSGYSHSRDVATAVTGNVRTARGTTVRIARPDGMTNDECSVEISISSANAFNHTVSNWDSKSEGRVDLLSIVAALESSEPDAYEVTTMLTRVPLNPATSRLRSRGVTVETSKQVVKWNAPGEFTDEPWNSGWLECIVDMAVDPRVGRMQHSDIPVVEWVFLRIVMNDYFNDDVELGYFGWVFDGDDTTFEDMINTVASAMGLVAYRIGSDIHFRHIKPQTVPVLLFNCRNKLPGSETRTVRFGREDNVDHVVIDYTDREDGSYEKRSVSVPDTWDVDTPLSVGVVGLQYQKQANMLASRRYYQTIYEYIGVEFEATEEAALLLPGDLILNVDSTKSLLLEGDLTNVSGTTLTLSNDIQLRAYDGATTEFVVFLQMPDGTVIVRDILNPTHDVVNTIVVDDVLPDSSTDDTNFARTTFYIVEDTADAGESDLFIVDKVSPEDPGTYRVMAHNYDERVYQNDPT